jgi:hypothetical protein
MFYAVLYFIICQVRIKIIIIIAMFIYIVLLFILDGFCSITGQTSSEPEQSREIKKAPISDGYIQILIRTVRQKSTITATFHVFLCNRLIDAIIK